VRVQGAERLAALALASVGVASLLLYLARPATIILWTQDPCQSVPKDMTGVWGFLIGVVLALGAALVAVRRRGPRWEVPLLVVAGLALAVPPLPRIIGMIVRVRRDPSILLNERLAAIGPLDSMGVVLGLALLICALLVWATAGRAVPHDPKPLPVVVGTGCAMAATAVGIVPLAPEWLLTGPLLSGQYTWPGWYPVGGPGIAMSAGARNAAILMWVMVALLGVATQSWMVAANAASRVKGVVLGLAGALLVGALPALHQLVVEAWHQTMVGFHLGPFVAAAQHAIAMLGTAMVACALALIFWPRSETVADGA